MALDDFTCDEIKEYKVADNNSEVILTSSNPLDQIIFGHGWGESKCKITGHTPPLYKECTVKESVFNKSLRRELND